MTQYDERGVVVPAPLQGSDAALAGKRYGDKHRGPAVSDAYELSRCWIDLADRSERWPFPSELPPRMVDLAQAIPEDQRSDWLRRQANLEDMDRRISYAIRSGDLPIWVAPHGEPERLVAVGALATIDKRSIAGGVFCPQSEEYKADADRPWLWERPLFVKCDDWVSFATEVDAERLPGVAKSPGTREPKFAPNLQLVAPPYHGGAGQLRRLDGIAVPNSIRLNDAVADLANGISNGPDLSDSETAIEFKFYSSDSDLLREWQTREVAMFYVREAVQSGKLLLYTMLVNGAHPIDRHALRELNFRTLKNGIYEPTNGREPLAGTALWILKGDWDRFKRSTLAARIGEPLVSVTNCPEPPSHRAKGVHAIMPSESPESTARTRAPSVKAGRPPSDDEILAKADEMKSRGMDGRTIAKEMRLEPGFQNVATTAVRELIKGRWKPGGRPKKGA
ncbi:hypothetical protein GRI40_07245 [Altererythrobacter aerius]|uniref:Uncharacterized protein n=1 Tax=Tsuneonella aeria TaxID=1837929 RepID=A0A6I4TDY8_9SPHN|nr:hypothetical protein [Tsuneonella aeria]MXO75014.1 hypothetical protein [Tsuneonella aeria]